MSDNQLSEAPLDLLNTGRDELVDGHSPIQIVSQDDDAAAEPAQPKPCHRCDTSHREIVVQFRLLLPDAVMRKPR